MNSDPQTFLFERGLAYLYQVRSLAVDPDLIDFVHDTTARQSVCVWIGSYIDAVNAQLQGCLQACHACFHPWQRRSIQVLAAPLVRQFGIDGLCNLQTQPISILVDVARVVPEDWLALVVHEYAHAHLGVPGHHADFVQVLSHLCLALDLPAADYFPSDHPHWRSFPPYRATPNPTLFWAGVAPSLPFPS